MHPIFRSLRASRATFSLGLLLACTPLAGVAQTNARLVNETAATPQPAVAPAAPARNTTGTSAQVRQVPPAAVQRAPAPAAAPQARADSPEQVGDVTRALFAAQADGRRAGPELPVLGPVASNAYKRYLDSFAYPIPEKFNARVSVGTSSGGSN